MSGKPIDEAALTTVSFLDGGVVQMDRADYDRLTAAQQQGRAVAIEGTDAEVLREFIRICREHKPVGQWPGERVCAAIERSMANERPFRFIAEADMAPEREPSMKDADRALSGPRRNAAPPPSAPVGVEARAFALWHPERKEYGNVIVGDPSLLREDYKEHGYVIVALAQQPAAVDEAYPTPRNRAEAAALARLALAHLGVIDAHIDAAIARCETNSAAQPGGSDNDR